jgi:hypothetical protein
MIAYWLMPNMQADRLFVAAVAVAIGVAGPSSAWGHGLAHARESAVAHAGGGSHAPHDGAIELHAADHPDSHQHGRLDQAVRVGSHTPDAGVALVASGPTVGVDADRRVHEILRSAVSPPDVHSGAPPRLRAPPAR